MDLGKEDNSQLWCIASYEAENDEFYIIGHPFQVKRQTIDRSILNKTVQSSNITSLSNG